LQKKLRFPKKENLELIQEIEAEMEDKYEQVRHRGLHSLTS
jgi:hypothetical protein